MLPASPISPAAAIVPTPGKSQKALDSADFLAFLKTGVGEAPIADGEITLEPNAAEFAGPETAGGKDLPVSLPGLPGGLPEGHEALLAVLPVAPVTGEAAPINAAPRFDKPAGTSVLPSIATDDLPPLSLSTGERATTLTDTGSIGESAAHKSAMRSEISAQPLPASLKGVSPDEEAANLAERAATRLAQGGYGPTPARPSGTPAAALAVHQATDAPRGPAPIALSVPALAMRAERASAPAASTIAIATRDILSGTTPAKAKPVAISAQAPVVESIATAPEYADPDPDPESAPQLIAPRAKAKLSSPSSGDTARPEIARIALADGAPERAIVEPRQPVHYAPASAPIARVQGETPAEFGQLVERLAQAREAASPDAVRTAVRHAEFGTVNLQFRAADARINVTMASADPDFAVAVQAAGSPATMAFSSNGDSPAQGQNRNEGQGSAQSGAQNSAESGQSQAQARSQGSPREGGQQGRSAQSGNGNGPQQSVPRNETPTGGRDRRGIYA